jgi:hypothetical protein
MVQKDIRAAGNGRRSSDITMDVARGLGWFSIGLGLVELLSPDTLTKSLGMEGKESLLRAYGARELAAGIGILSSRQPAPWVWGRVAGDIQDLATLATGMRQDNPRKTNVALALAAVAGITALDAVCAKALGNNVRRRSDRAIRDYSHRSGFPKPPEQMRGAARDLQIPKDMRTPEPLRAFTSQPSSERSAMEHSRA